MQRITVSVALTLALSILAFAQTSTASVKQSELERKLIILSSEFVDTAIGKQVAEVGDRFTLTPSGPMQIAYIKQKHESVRLEVRNIKSEGVNAVVEGQVRFKSRSSEATDLEKLINIKISFRNQDEQWKVTAACLGECEKNTQY